MSAVSLLDQQIFSFVYSLPHPGIITSIAQFLSGIGKAGIIWFLIGFVLFIREEKKDHRFFIPIFLTGGASWVFVDFILKPLIGRPRPTEILTDFSFPSGHATIAWAMAIVLSRYEPRWRWMFYVLAVLISLSRMYLGVHYPLDVLGGAVLGWGISRVARRFVV